MGNTLVETPRYIQVVSDLTPDEIYYLSGFMETRDEFTCLVDLVTNKKRPVSQIFRGTQYRKKDLVLGETYAHWNMLSSWSLSQDVAIGFALDCYIPDDLVDSVLEELGHSLDDMTHESPEWSEVYAEFEDVVFVLNDTEGFVVEEHLVHDIFNHEKEVILNSGSWIMTDIVEKFNVDGNRFIEVTLANIENS